MSSVSLYNIQKEKTTTKKKHKKNKKQVPKTRVTRTRNSNKFTENQKNQQKPTNPQKKTSFSIVRTGKVAKIPEGRRTTTTDRDRR